jgi:phage terminase large subunit
MLTGDRAINLNDCVTSIFWANYAALHYCPEKLILNNGGGGSSKTTSLCQLFATVLMLDPTFQNQRLVIARESMPALKRSTMLETISVLRNWGLYSEKDHNKTDHVIRGKNGNTLQFMAMEDMDPDKVKSMNISMLFLDEATQINAHTFKVARMYVGRNANDVGKFFLGYNPNNAGCYIAKDIEADLAYWKAMIIHSTYKDNPFLHPDKAEELEALAEQDQNFYRIYCKGEWGSFEGVIFVEGQNFRATKGLSEAERKRALKVYGLDLGFHSPFLVECGVTEGGTCYVREIISEHDLTTTRLMQLMAERGVSRTDELIYDCEDANAGAELYEAGWNAIPCTKGKDSVVNSIGTLKKNAGTSKGPLYYSSCARIAGRRTASATAWTRPSSTTITDRMPSGMEDSASWN